MAHKPPRNDRTSAAGPVAKWWTYQRERFPVLAHGPLIAAFSFSAVSYSYLLRSGTDKGAAPSGGAFLVAFVTCLLFFLQLRIADEFKDFEEDSRFRPYRAVPRGLVTLRELGGVFILAAGVQLLLALGLRTQLLPLLAINWVYLALMGKEFFVRDWIKARPITYMWTHMLIMPLVDFYATACDWCVSGIRPPRGLIWFLAVSYCNGFVIEIGRKIRAPEDEEEGVATYTVLWGRRRAVFAWLGMMGCTALFALAAAWRIDFLAPMGGILAALLLSAAFVSRRFLTRPIPRRAKWFEVVSGVWTLLMYLGLGAIPFWLQR